MGKEASQESLQYTPHIVDRPAREYLRHSQPRDSSFVSENEGRGADTFEDRLFVERIKGILGGVYGFEPFRFDFFGKIVPAQNAGLEGFLYTFMELRRFGFDAGSQLDYFFSYSKALLTAAHFQEEAEGLEEIRTCPSSSAELKLELLLRRLWRLTAQCRRLLEAQDKARWIREGCTYQIFLRAFNLAGHRSFDGSAAAGSSEKLFKEISPADLPDVQAIRWTGTYPIGIVNVKGDAGGSPFSIKCLSRIDPAHGGDLPCARKLNELCLHGFHNLFELVINHTAIDGDLVDEDPTLYVHVDKRPDNTFGFHRYYQQRSGREYWIRLGGYRYFGSRYYWDDTLQLDISNPRTRRLLIDRVCSLVDVFGVNGFRVDMAYQLLHESFSTTWSNELRYPLSPRLEDEFLAELIREVKIEHPETGFIAEAFDSWERLSAVGFDVIYGQNDMELAGGLRHPGWYDALKSRDAWVITESIKLAAFLHWQHGGAAMLAFIGHHDLPLPQRVFGDFVYGAAFLTLFLPSAHTWYAGTEAGFEEPCEENAKMISFNKRACIKWRGKNDSFYRFIMNCFEQASALRREFGSMEMLPLWAENGERWVGYLLRPMDRTRLSKYSAALALTNLSDAQVQVLVNRPDLGIRSFTHSLEKRGLWGQELIWLPRS